MLGMKMNTWNLVLLMRKATGPRPDLIKPVNNPANTKQHKTEN